jgi:excisionase family DNA binding protein
MARLMSSETEKFKKHDSDDLPAQIRKLKRALSAQQLAELLSFTRSYILKRAKAGKIPSYRIGGAVRFDPIRVADWLEEQAV